MWGEGTTTLGWTKRTDPMPYTDIVSFTMAGRKQSSQCQSSQTPTNHTSDESKRVSGLWRGTKMSYLTVAKSSFKERSQHPECRGDLHRSDQCQRRVQKTHICRRGFKEHIWRGFKKNTFAVCRRPTRWTRWPQTADRRVHRYCSDPATHQHQPWNVKNCF